MSLSEPHRPLRFPVGRERTNFRNRDIPLAEKDRFPPRQPPQIARKMGFGFVDIEPNHGSLMDERYAAEPLAAVTMVEPTVPAGSSDVSYGYQETSVPVTSNSTTSCL